MRCPECNNSKYKVIDSRRKHGIVRRRRECARCKHRAFTIEMDEVDWTKLDQLRTAAKIVLGV